MSFPKSLKNFQWSEISNNSHQSKGPREVSQHDQVFPKFIHCQKHRVTSGGRPEIGKRTDHSDDSWAFAARSFDWRRERMITKPVSMQTNPFGTTSKWSILSHFQSKVGLDTVKGRKRSCGPAEFENVSKLVLFRRLPQNLSFFPLFLLSFYFSFIIHSMKYLCLALLVCVLVNLVSAIYIPNNKNFFLQEADNVLVNDELETAEDSTKLITPCGDETDVLT